MWDKVKCKKFWEVKDAGDQPDGNGKEKEIEVRVVVQTLRLVAYTLFALLIIITIVLTEFVHGGIPEDNMIKKTFGSNNICLYFDFPPAIYITPIFWTFVVVVVGFFCAASIYRYRIAWAEGKISTRARKILSAISFGYLWSTMCFSICLAIKPDDHFTMIIHTLPFTHLIFWQIWESGANVYFGFNCMWTECDGNCKPLVPAWFKWGCLVHWILQTLHGFPHMAYQLNGLMKEGGYFIDVHQQWFAELGTFSGRMYLFLSFICPVLQGVIETILNDRTHKLKVIIRDNRKAEA